MGVAHCVKDVCSMSPLEVLNLSVPLAHLLKECAIDTVLVSMKNHDLLKDVLRVICKVDGLKIFVELPSSVEATKVSVCNVIVLNRRVTRYTLLDIKNFTNPRMYRIPRVDFSKIDNVRHWSTLLHLQSGLAGNALAHKTSTSPKTLSSRKIKIAQEMHITGANSAVLFRLMNLFVHIYALNKSANNCPPGLFVGAKVNKSFNEGYKPIPPWNYHRNGGHVFYTG